MSESNVKKNENKESKRFISVLLDDWINFASVEEKKKDKEKLKFPWKWNLICLALAP